MGDTIIGFTLFFDPNAAGFGWHEDDGDVPASDMDLQSVATHEAGHVAGFGVLKGEPPHPHLSTPCGDTADRSTMCALAELGNKRWRTLEEHDLHTLSGAYAPPGP